MRITQGTLPLISALRAGGLNAHVRGWDRGLRSLFPINHQSDVLVRTSYCGRPYVAAPGHFVDWQVLTTGSYERTDLAIFELLLKRLERSVVLDIGTNVGHHAFFFAVLGAHVHAFEPNPELWPLIEAKIEAARLDNIVLHKVGLGDADAVLGFRVPDMANSGTGTFLASAPGDDGEQQLPIRHGDSYLAALGIDHVDVVKIDIQGFEPQALGGLARTLAHSRPVVSVEIGDENRESIPSLEALQALLPAGYAFRFVENRTRMLFRRSRLVELTGQAFTTFDGNLYCVPGETVGWLDSAAADALA